MNAASHDRPRLTVGVAGACYYLPIERFLATTDRFVEKVTGDCVAERRFIAMKDTVSAAHHANATRWLSGHGPFLDISAYAMAAGAIIYAIVKRTVGIRLTDEQQRRGADLSIHSIGATPEEF